MRGFKYLAAAAAMAGLLAGPSAAGASAATSPSASPRAAAVHLVGGATSVTTAAGLAGVLLNHGIVPLAAWPGSQSVLSASAGPAVRFTFPVTGGRVTLSPLGGQIDHDGGILFLNLRSGKSLEVGRFTIDLAHADLTGIVNGHPKARVPLFRLDLSHATLTAGRHAVTARGISLTLTAVAARALDAALGTGVFSAGLNVGTASTLLRF
jgi:hypothetical protein